MPNIYYWNDNISLVRLDNAAKFIQAGDFEEVTLLFDTSDFSLKLRRSNTPSSLPTADYPRTERRDGGPAQAIPEVTRYHPINGHRNGLISCPSVQDVFGSHVFDLKRLGALETAFTAVKIGLVSDQAKTAPKGEGRGSLTI
jgi:hypothetical protein